MSCWLYKGQPVIDLDYAEDSAAETDSNFVLTGKGGIVEVQAPPRASRSRRRSSIELLGLAKAGVRQLVELQRKVIA